MSNEVGRLSAMLWGALALCVLLAILLKGCTDPAPVPAVVVDTASAAAWRAQAIKRSIELADARAEGTGWRARAQRAENALRGIQARPPERVTVYDTTLNITNDQVIRGASIEGGRLELEILRPLKGGHRPERAFFNVKNCDDGLTVSSETVVCNRARFGHLTTYAEVGAANDFTVHAEAGLSWQPSFRSNLRVDVGMDLERRVFAGVRFGVRLF